MAIKALVGTVGGGVIAFLMLRSWQTQFQATDTAVSSSVNSSATWQTTEIVLESTGLVAGQLPMLGLIAVVIGLLAVATALN